MLKPGSFALFMTLLACSSSSTVAPNAAAKINKARSWGQEYAQALIAVRTQPAQACASFQNLAVDPASPVAPLATVRYLENCQLAQPGPAITQLDQMGMDPANVWLQPLITEAVVNLALASRHHSGLVKYSLARTKQLGSQREKESLLREAIASARALNLPAKVVEFETELYRLSPRSKPNPTEAEWLKAAEDFRANEEWTPAAALYDRIIVSPRTSVMDQFRARDGLRQIFKAKFRFYNGSLSDFMDASLRVAEFAEENVLRPGRLTFDERRILFEAWIQYSRDQWSYGDVDIAHREIGRMINEAGLDLVFKSHAYWTLSRVHANNGDWMDAAIAGERSVRILENDLPQSANWSKWQWALWDDALWAAALASRKNQDWTSASSLLDLGLRHTPNAGAQVKFTFWLAQSLKDQGIVTVAHEYLRKLTALDPFGFYGFLAHRDLGLALSSLPDMDLENPVRPPSVGESDFDLLTGLVYAEELSLAQKHSQRVLNPTSVDPDQLILRAFVHDYPTILSLVFSRLAAADRNAFTEKYARLFYPRPFAGPVAAATQRNPRIDPEYVYSIMRQESGFNPLSHSWANAYGLLQLLPQVARESQAKAGLTFNEDFELYRPEINIPLGVAHMDDLIDRASPSFILRTSSYNAPVEKTLEWRARLYTGNIYEFLEEIPYDETRSYIRLVMRNYLMNLRLNATAPFLFPETLLDL